MKINSLDLGKEPILPLLLKMSMPSIAAMLVMGLYNLIDAVWLARCNTLALAAYTISFPIQLLLFSIGIGTGIGSGAFASQMLGANKTFRARQAAGQSLFLALFLGLVIIFLVLTYCQRILLFFGAIPAIADMAREYLEIYSLGAPMLLFVMMANNLLRAEGRPKTSMGILLLLAGLGMILDPILIFGYGPIPALGLRGAAIASLIAHSFAASLAAYYLYQGASRYQIGLTDMKPNFSILLSIYKTGLPSIVMNMLFMVTIIIFNYALAPFGAASLASLGLAMRSVGLINMVLIAVGHGVMPIIGFSKGAHAYQRLRETVRVGNILCVSFAALCTVLVIAFTPYIVRMFTSDKELLEYGAQALRMFIMPLVLSAPMIIWINMFLGLGRGGTALALMSLRDCLFMAPLMFVLPPLLGFKGVWIAYFIAICLAFLATMAVAQRTLRQISNKTSQ